MSRALQSTPFGNRCGHDPLNPRLEPLPSPASDSRLTLDAIDSIRQWLAACFSSPPKCPLFNRQPSLRKMRSERREACLLVLLTLMRHLDPISFCLGFRHSNGQFSPLTIKYIVMETGLGSRRCERAVSDLRRAQALETNSPAPGRSVLALNRDFVEWLLWETSLWELGQKSQASPTNCAHEGEQP